MEHKQKQLLEAYEQYADAIYRHCYFRIYHKEKAEELVQETYMRVWEYLKNGNEVDNIRAFLYRAATNLVIDHSRKAKEQSLEHILEHVPALEPSADGRQEIEAKTALRELLRVVDQLDEKDRNFILMRYAEGLQPKEIAGALDISANQASVGIHRAVKKLKTFLNDQ